MKLILGVSLLLFLMGRIRARTTPNIRFSSSEESVTEYFSMVKESTSTDVPEIEKNTSEEPFTLNYESILKSRPRVGCKEYCQTADERIYCCPIIPGTIPNDLIPKYVANNGTDSSEDGSSHTKKSPNENQSDPKRKRPASPNRKDNRKKTQKERPSQSHRPNKHGMREETSYNNQEPITITEESREPNYTEHQNVTEATYVEIQDTFPANESNARKSRFFLTPWLQVPSEKVKACPWTSPICISLFVPNNGFCEKDADCPKYQLCCSDPCASIRLCRVYNEIYP